MGKEVSGTVVNMKKINQLFTKKEQFYYMVILGLLLLNAWFSATQPTRPWNHPYPATLDHERILFSSFPQSPKTLDPARSFSTDESIFLGQICEPPLQYHYLKRPYVLEPLILKQLPAMTYQDNARHIYSTRPNHKKISKVIYDLQLRSDIRYAPHPAFVRDSGGHYQYHAMKELPKEWVGPYQFDSLDTRNATAEDLVYQIKRLADPAVNSPIYSIFAEYIEDFSELRARIAEWRQKHPNQFLDLRNIPFAGIRILDPLHLQIYLKAEYPPFQYWLASHFIVPIPWEVDRFYDQKILREKNITMSSYPVGTGPFYLNENNPNRRMYLLKSPTFHIEYFPKAEDLNIEQAKEFQSLVGQLLPLMDGIMFVLEQEAIPRWNKFLQGYYDASAVSTDTFHQAVELSEQDQLKISASLEKKGIRLSQEISPSLWYWGVNMLDPLLGAMTEKGRKLRQALSIALNVEEYITIFHNGAGHVAFGVVPLGWSGSLKRFNPYTHHDAERSPQRHSLEMAKQLLAQAGYPRGIDPGTGKPLVLHLDSMSGSNADSAYYTWFQNQFEPLGIEVEIRDTTYNRFQDKMMQGEAQLFQWGWAADYPDPENFLGIFYGPNGKVQYKGENATNYNNPMFNDWYEKIRILPASSSERLNLIVKMQELLQKDAPLLGGYFDKSLVLRHRWVGPVQYHAVAQNTLKYMSVNPALRHQCRMAWNQPKRMVLNLTLVMLWLSLGSGLFYYRRQKILPSIHRLKGH